MKKQTLIYIGIFIVVLAGALGFGASCATDTPLTQQDIPTSDTIDVNMQRIETLYRSIDENFLFEFDHELIYDEMAKALFAALDDPYSSYITEEESQALTDLAFGVYGGIGAYISKPNPDTIDLDDPQSYRVTIVSPFVGSPAYKAGLHAGDLISHIDGNDVIELTVGEAASQLRGEPGTIVNLTITRGGSTFKIKVEREVVEIPTVQHDLIDSVGYIHILEFTPYTPEKVLEALQSFAETGFTSLIIDLRSNPGGSVDASQQIADMFLSDDTVFTLETNDPEDTAVVGTQKQTTIPVNVPIVMLIDGGSASSAEILAGAMKDNERVILIGSTSFGKGLVQGVYPYGNDYFKLTTARYLTPNGSDIHKIGIEPDIPVELEELTDEQIEEYITILNEDLFSEFVIENPVQNQAVSDSFIQSIISDGSTLSERYLQRILRLEYQYLMDFPPVYDLDFDTVLKRALQYLSEGE